MYRLSWHFSFQHSHSCLACEVSVEKSAGSFFGDLGQSFLNKIIVFSRAAFQILSLSLDSFNRICLGEDGFKFEF